VRIARCTADAIGLRREIRDDEVLLDERDHAGITASPMSRRSPRWVWPPASRAMITARL
jgi:hypothetical protein